MTGDILIDMNIQSLKASVHLVIWMEIYKKDQLVKKKKPY